MKNGTLKYLFSVLESTVRKLIRYIVFQFYLAVLLGNENTKFICSFSGLIAKWFKVIFNSSEASSEALVALF